MSSYPPIKNRIIILISSIIIIKIHIVSYSCYFVLYISPLISNSEDHPPFLAPAIAPFESSVATAPLRAIQSCDYKPPPQRCAWWGSFALAKSAKFRGEFHREIPRGFMGMSFYESGCLWQFMAMRWGCHGIFRDFIRISCQPKKTSILGIWRACLMDDRCMGSDFMGMAQE